MYHNCDPRSGHEKSFHPNIRTKIVNDFITFKSYLLFVIVSWLSILPLGNSVYFTAKRGINDVSFFLSLFIYRHVDRVSVFVGLYYRPTLD